MKLTLSRLYDTVSSEEMIDKMILFAGPAITMLGALLMIAGQRWQSLLTPSCVSYSTGLSLVAVPDLLSSNNLTIAAGSLAALTALLSWNITGYRLLGFRTLKPRYWPAVTAVMIFGGRDGRRLLRMIATIKDRKGIR